MRQEGGCWPGETSRPLAVFIQTDRVKRQFVAYFWKGESVSRSCLFPMVMCLATLLVGSFSLYPTTVFSQDEPAPTEPAPLGEREIRLEIKIGDEVTRFAPISLREGETELSVESIMKRLAETERRFSFEARGEGETFFVTRVLGRENEGRGGRNWFLLIDQQLSPRGAGSAKVGGKTVVTWVYRGGGLE